MVVTSELDVQPAREYARARIDVVVDAVQPGRRIDAAVPRDREHALRAGEEAHLSAFPRERVAHRDVVHPQERPTLDIVVRQIVRLYETGLQDGRAEVVGRAARQL